MTLAQKAGRYSFHKPSATDRPKSRLVSIILLLSLLLPIVFVPSFACEGHDEENAAAEQVSRYDNNEQARPPVWTRTDEETRLNQLALINNEGVRALQKNDFKVAISKFEETLRLDPSYKYGRSNLGIAFNNYALSLRERPKEALVYFEKAAYVDPGNRTTESNVNAVIQMLGLDPQDSKTREKLGDERVQQRNFEGAIVEYRAAQNLGLYGASSKVENAYQMLVAKNRADRPEEPYWRRLLLADYDAWAFLPMFALYMLDLCIVVECMRRLSSQKRTWWIIGMIIATISVFAGFLLGQAGAFRDVLGLLVLGLPPARALYAVTKKPGGDLGYIAYLAVVWIAAVPCALFFLGWLACVAAGWRCSG